MEHIANCFAFIRYNGRDVNKCLHFGIVGSSRGYYCSTVGVPRQGDRTLLL